MQSEINDGIQPSFLKWRKSLLFISNVIWKFCILWKSNKDIFTCKKLRKSPSVDRSCEKWSVNFITLRKMKPYNCLYLQKNKSAGSNRTLTNLQTFQASAPQAHWATTLTGLTPQAHWATTQQACQAAASPPPTTGGLQHHQMLPLNLPRRHKQTGLASKGVTPEQLVFLNRWFFSPFFKVLAVLFAI
jgi:hypothetical protein